jgi:acyl-CoA synthetase (AMP-forming)/AMP-acid ligase II
VYCPIEPNPVISPKSILQRKDFHSNFTCHGHPSLWANTPQDKIQSKSPAPSLLRGPTTPPLLNLTLGQLLDQQASSFPSNTAIKCPFNTWTYTQFRSQALSLARGIQSLGIQPGDRIGVLAGNSAEYIALFFAVAYLGGILVILNSTYTKEEAKNALPHSGCRVLFTSERIGRVSLEGLLSELGPCPNVGGLERVVLLRGERQEFLSYGDVQKMESLMADEEFRKIWEGAKPDDVCNLQYTSGTTGQPKAAMFTHF